MSSPSFDTFIVVWLFNTFYGLSVVFFTLLEILFSLRLSDTIWVICIEISVNRSLISKVALDFFEILRFCCWLLHCNLNPKSYWVVQSITPILLLIIAVQFKPIGSLYKFNSLLSSLFLPICSDSMKLGHCNTHTSFKMCSIEIVFCIFLMCVLREKKRLQ